MQQNKMRDGFNEYKEKENTIELLKIRDII